MENRLRISWDVSVLKNPDRNEANPLHGKDTDGLLVSYFLYHMSLYISCIYCDIFFKIFFSFVLEKSLNR